MEFAQDNLLILSYHQALLQQQLLRDILRTSSFLLLETELGFLRYQRIALLLPCDPLGTQHMLLETLRRALVRLLRLSISVNVLRYLTLFFGQIHALS